MSTQPRLHSGNDSLHEDSGAASRISNGPEDDATAAPPAEQSTIAGYRWQLPDATTEKEIVWLWVGPCFSLRKSLTLQEADCSTMQSSWLDKVYFRLGFPSHAQL